MGNKKKLSLSQKQNISGWIFLTPATVLIAVMSFYPMIRAIIISIPFALLKAQNVMKMFP